MRVAQSRLAVAIRLGALSAATAIAAAAAPAAPASTAPPAPDASITRPRPSMPARHIVSLGGDVTEIVYALGQQARLACDDQTSLYPSAARNLPQVGYLRTLSAEGVLSCRPDLILASEDAGPAAAMAELAESGVPLVHVSNAHSPEGVLTKIAQVARALGVGQRGQVLEAQFRAALAAARAQVATLPGHPRALFLMAQGPGGAMAAGRNTAADAMLRLAGARNVAEGFSGYKPLTAEAALALQPDVIVIAEFALKMLGGPAVLRARPEIAATPAGRTGRIVPMDALLMLGFGPRTPEAIRRLALALRGEGVRTARTPHGGRMQSLRREGARITAAQ